MFLYNNYLSNSIIPPVITVDGTSSSGKGTLCIILAQILHWNILDSGSIYRIIDLLAYNKNISCNNEEKLLSIVKKIDISFKIYKNKLSIMLEGKDVSCNIYKHYINNKIFHIASSQRIREELLHYQRKFRIFPGLIADGRDMGTIVFPDAKIKIFLDANLEKRAQRRFQQLQKRNVNVTLNEVFSEIKKRDYLDKSRKIAPLIKANDAFIIDSTHLSIHEVVMKVIKYINVVKLK
ncbi:MAG: cytidylate kinase [Candidatus Westeberhardia cardiocondylae]|nr:cytidylate kinase [Candidatus Westeberhardia cardiocondylae]